ncbi:unnamed protein product [Ilex paraguariensis]|uniref:Uncharacterized protein n=1 Tax=Ilex paraguariensis TaxID=185542 RepID=A0ABC8U8I2_9AQUA
MESENAGEGGNLTGDVLSVGMMEDGGVSQCVTQSMDNATVIPQSRKQRKKKDNVLMDAMTTSLGQMIKVFGAYVENSGNQLASIVYWVGYEQDAAIAHRNKLVEFPKIEGLSMQHGNEEVYKIACDFIKSTVFYSTPSYCWKSVSERHLILRPGALAPNGGIRIIQRLLSFDLIWYANSLA